MKRTLLKWLKRTGWFVLILFLSVNIFILLSGRFYLYKGIYYTYLQGETSPTIYDLNKFYNATVEAPKKGEPWSFNLPQGERLSKEDLKYMDTWRTSSFLVVKNNQVIYEHYWDEHHPETVSNSFSAAKTVVSILIGMALEDGDIKSLDEPVYKYIPEFTGKGKEKITIRHLLAMSSGLDWTESGKNPLSENAESYYGWDLRGLVTRQHVERAPGKEFIYQSGNSQLLAFILEKATGKDLSQYASERLWQPIGAVSNAFWSLDKKNGDEKAFCCLYSTTRDFARIGKLLIHHGKWNGKQIIPAAYFDEMVKNPVMTTEEGVPNTRYGLHIWTYVSNGHPVYYCRGIKGQYIISIPDEQLIIVRTGHKRAPDTDPKILETANTKENQEKIGHPSDLFEYIRMGREIAGEDK
ncbi:serine hydrolase domain-containing protein [Fluviicola chungangensis]|uniref:Serine hydrolase n=1 Tax=Fluviicola chungangensis TaxID=2597671 RepID=A0A556N007_9FLAO|nr:serine hydrolase [Fluviicola chungangensis]TSJ45521.1 serine hydrolase [Fluviicola chungangensis]